MWAWECHWENWTQGPKQMKIWAKYLSVILQTSTILKMHVKLIPKEKGKPMTETLQFPSREDIQRSWTFPAIPDYVQVPVGLNSNDNLLLAIVLNLNAFIVN